ncbi:MAG: glycosyltransferase family 4 protein [Mollicutes bacterium]|nr:glycosyltransferase family 4 protein [Mollicutes bacterium]
MKKKITIGIFNDSFYPMADGVILVIDNYARRLSKYANVIVFVPKYFRKKYDDSKFPYKVVRCHSLKMPLLDYSLPIPKLDVKFRKILNKHKLDIVHIHSPFTLGVAGYEYAEEHNIPCVATMHSQFKQDFEKAVKVKKIATKLTDKLIRFFNKCDECWAVNSEVARIYYEEYGYKTMPRVMNNATEMVTLKDLKKACDKINKLHNITAKTKVFLFVGRINTLKNILFIADSLKYIKDQKPSWAFKMIYVGAGRDEEKLKDKISDLSLENDVILTGKIMDRELLASYFARADLFLFPSVYDASSIVQIEAASQKTPCVFLKGTATAATVTDDVNGFLSDYTVEDYGNKIISVINNEKHLKKVSNNAHKQLYKKWDDVVDGAYEIYLDLINKK